ncbi:MAG TPA: hypothetical protein VLV78_06655 [Thermoanaerobaculia bacterium]|nr:hypothetical protein [Thermoanaerobaculia bacterium]
MQRKEPPPGFRDRVVQSANRRHLNWRAVAATLMLTAVLGGWTVHTIAERRAGERARREVLLALHIAGEKVHYAQSQVQDIGRK